MTNRAAARRYPARLLCEWRPGRPGHPATMDDLYHALAAVELGDGFPLPEAGGWGFLRTCRACAARPELAALRERGLRELGAPRRLAAVVSGGPAEVTAGWQRMAKEGGGR